MGPDDWVEIAATIHKHYYDYDGFVCIHGTDTMAYTASALSFMFVNLGKPVILVGSMLPFGEVHSDARRNLSVSVMIAGSCSQCLPEVCIFFNDRLMRGNRCSKIDSASIAAFESQNFPPLAVIGTSLSINESLVLPSPKGRFSLHSSLETRIVVLRLVPGFLDLDALVGSEIRGVVLMLYGTGNAPAKKSAFVSWVKRMTDNGKMVVACSQCQRGRVVLEAYSVGKALHDAGVISALDMTCEAAVTKMAYLLSLHLSPRDLRVAFQASLRGELTDAVDAASLLRRKAQSSKL